MLKLNSFRGLSGRLMPKGKFGRSVTMLASGTVVGNLIYLLASPLITRIYSPEQFGIFSLFMMFVGVGSVSASLRYESAIVSAKSETEAGSLVVLCTGLVFAVSAVFASVMYAFINCGVAGFEQLPKWCVLAIFFALVVNGLFFTVRYYYLWNGDFLLLSKVPVFQGGGRSAGQILLGLSGLGLAGLIAGEIIGRLAGLWRLLGNNWASLYSTTKYLSFSSVSSVVKKYSDFPIYGLPSSFLDTLAVNLPVPIIAALYGLESAGLYALVQRAFGLPLALVGKSVGDVFHSEIASLYLNNPSRSRYLMKRTAGKLSVLGAVLVVVTVAVGPHVFSILFGEAWGMAGTLAAIMSPWFALQLVVSPVSRLVFVVDGQKTKLIFDVLSGISVLLSFYGGFFLGFDLVWSVAVLSFLNLVVYSIYYLLLFRLLPT